MATLSGSLSTLPLVLQVRSVRFPCKCGLRPLRAGRLRGRGTAPPTPLKLVFGRGRICEIRVSFPLKSFEDRDIFVPTLGALVPVSCFLYFLSSEDMHIVIVPSHAGGAVSRSSRLAQ